MPIRTKQLRKGLLALLVAPATLATVQGCTDLTEVPRSDLTPSNTFRTTPEILGGVASAFASLRGTMWGYYNLSEVSTDEVIVPTRGSDWFDNGRWLEIHRQGWSPNSGSALDDMNGTWNDLFGGVARANLVLSSIEQNNVTGQENVVAELRGLRAFYYMLLMDMFGGVPLVTDPVVEARPRASRDSVFRFVESELRAVRGTLPRTRPADEYGRLTRGAVDAMLASLYINAPVYTGTVSASGLVKNPNSQAYWTNANAFADSVINSGAYNMNGPWSANFAVDNENSAENIFVVRHVAQPGLGMTIQMRGLHYNQLSPAPWNGFATIAETYNKFDAADARRNIFLVGPQVAFGTGQPVNDRAGARLNYTVTIANPTQATESEGARFNKYTPLVGAPDGNHPNDFVYYRLAEMHLIKAEALNELGQPAAAVAQINLVRARHFTPPRPITATTQAAVRTAVLNERLFELAGEAKRRQDLIRFGQYTQPTQFKTTAAAPYKVLMPIPQSQLQTNPLLDQNPGY